MSAPDRAESFVLGWARHYTGALPEEVTERRVLELASDCFEQRRRGREVGAHPTAVAASMVVRTLAGMPADLIWRNQVLAAHRGRPLSQGGRPMGRWIKDNWWVALGGLVAAVTTVLGVGLPFEDNATLGSLLGGIVIGLLGLTGIAGVVVRRRPGRRTVGDLMLVAGQLPWIPFFWAIVPPILALIVIVRAFIDISDAASTGNDSVGGPPPTRRGAVTTGLLAVLLVAVAAAVVVEDPSFALAVPMPVAVLLLVHLAVGRRLAETPLLHAAGLLVATPPLWFVSIFTVGLYEDGYGVDGRYELVVQAAGIVMLVLGIVLAVAGVRRGRQARPA